MYSGSRRQVGAQRGSGAVPGGRDDVGDQAFAWPVSRAMTTASATAGCAVRAVSISPSSMRNPRIFTWWSARPRNSSLPSGAGGPGRRCGTCGCPAAERVGDELVRGQARLAQVAAGQPGAGDVQLAGRAGGHRLEVGVEDVDAHVVERPADRHRVGHGCRGGMRVSWWRTWSSRSGRSRRRRSGPGRPPVPRRTAAAGTTSPPVQTSLTPVRQSGASWASSGTGPRSATARSPSAGRSAGAARRVRSGPGGHHYLRPRQQRDPQLVGRGVEGQRGVRQHPPMGAAPETAVAAPVPRRRGGARLRLWGPGRTGGVHRRRPARPGLLRAARWTAPRSAAPAVPWPLPRPCDRGGRHGQRLPRPGR